MLEQVIYESLPYVLAIAAAALGYVLYVSIRKRRQQNLAEQEILAERRKARLKSIQEAAHQARYGGSDAASNASAIQADEVGQAAALETAQAADGDAEEAPSKPAVSAGADPIANQFLRQIRFFEEQFNASLEPDEKRIVDTVLKDSFSCDLSLAAWWEKVRNDWENRAFVAHVDALHPNLSQT